MTYLISVVLVAVAAILLFIGATTVNVVAYIAAAVVSVIAVALLVKRARQNQEHPYVSDAPTANGPQWDRPIPRAGAQPRSDSLEIPFVPIDNYDDLVAAEVLPSLETLSVDELQAVIARERYGMARQAIIRRAETLIDLTLGSGAAERLTGQSTTRTIDPPRIDNTVMVVDEPQVLPDREIPEPPELKKSGPELGGPGSGPRRTRNRDIGL